jgi:hypothetical protein
VIIATGREAVAEVAGEDMRPANRRLPDLDKSLGHDGRR